MKKPKSEGKCMYCNQVFDKRSIAKHLDKHLVEMPVNDGKSYHIRVEGGSYFLQILMDGNATLKKLDTFLRAIWLECCGHLSRFSVGMNKKAEQVFEPGVQLSYEYDFGTTTELTVKVLSEYSFGVKKGIELLSRNEPLEISCDKCKTQPAAELCTAHWGEDEFFFCENCAELHKEECADAEYAMMSVVNSPRMGECGYEGGTIDTARDGHFQLKQS